MQILRQTLRCCGFLFAFLNETWAKREIVSVWGGEIKCAKPLRDLQGAVSNVPVGPTGVLQLLPSAASPRTRQKLL